MRFLSGSVLLLAVALALVNADIFPLSIIHINDLHARFEPTDQSGGTCNSVADCIGGYARTVHTVKRLLQEQKDNNPIFLNAGDNFQGTLWYNIGRWNVTSQMLNLLPADAMTLGNHEFDHGVSGVVPFLETLNTTMLVANMDDKDEPDLKGKYQKSKIFTRGDRKIGIIGVIVENTYDLANTGKLVFRNESDAIREEAQKLKAEGVNIIIVLSHCGYDVDQIIAKQVGEDIDVIVGSHSHTFLFTGDKLPGPDKPRGDYPTIVTHKTGHRVLIVQAAAYAKYVGNITVFFDDAGNVVDHQGAPIYMGHDVPEDAEVNEALKPWKEVIDAQGNVVIGRTVVDLLKSPCSSTECNLGNFFCDAMVHAITELEPYDAIRPWTNVSIALVNTGALRVPLYRGNITYSHLVAMSPFENTIVAFDLRGDKLIEALEYSVSAMAVWENQLSSRYFLQVAGLRVAYDVGRPVGKRLISIRVRCKDCSVPFYEYFDKDKIYRIVAPSFLTTGGDGFYMFRDYGTNFQHEMTDLDALLTYTKHFNPIYTGLEERIVVLNSGKPQLK